MTIDQHGSSQLQCFKPRDWGIDWGGEQLIALGALLRENYIFKRHLKHGRRGCSKLGGGKVAALMLVCVCEVLPPYSHRRLLLHFKYLLQSLLLSSLYYYLTHLIPPLSRYYP